MDGRRNILKCGFYCLCFCSWYSRSIETALLQGILCFTDKSGCNVLSVCTVLAHMQVSNHSLQDVIKLLLTNLWSCFRSTSKQTVEVMLPSVHATRHMCGTARNGTAELQVYLVSRRPVKFHSRSECTGKEKYLLPVPESKCNEGVVWN